MGTQKTLDFSFGDRRKSKVPNLVACSFSVVALRHVVATSSGVPELGPADQGSDTVGASIITNTMVAHS